VGRFKKKTIGILKHTLKRFRCQAEQRPNGKLKKGRKKKGGTTASGKKTKSEKKTKPPGKKKMRQKKGCVQPPMERRGGERGLKGGEGTWGV